MLFVVVNVIRVQVVEFFNVQAAAHVITTLLYTLARPSGCSEKISLQLLSYFPSQQPNAGKGRPFLRFLDHTQ
jgi:hypothetical protein